MTFVLSSYNTLSNFLRKNVQDFGVSKDKNDLGFVTFDLQSDILFYLLAKSRKPRRGTDDFLSPLPGHAKPSPQIDSCSTGQVKDSDRSLSKELSNRKPIAKSHSKKLFLWTPGQKKHFVLKAFESLG